MAFLQVFEDILVMEQFCEATYYTRKLNFPRLKHCSKKAIVERDGKSYCGLHDPEAIKVRNVKNEERKKIKRDQKMKLYYAYLKLKQKQ
jgi:hypothetical protein